VLPDGVDAGIRYYGLPWGYELGSLILGVVEAGKRESTLRPESIERLRGLEFVDSVVVEQRELRQLLRIQTRLAERAVAPLLAALAGTQVGRVSVREATLEDAYVRLVGRIE